MGRNPKSQRFSSGQSAAKQHASSRLGNHRLMAVSGMEDMPAVFPFEGLKMIEDEQMQMTTTTRRQQSSLFGALQTEFKRATSPQPRQKKLASDLSDLPTE